MMNANRVLNNANIKNLKDAVQNISLYDVKAYVRKAQNVMMNFTVMEAKVREATNNEPWGASSTLMQEIADGTFNYANFNEIMPMIYKRFTEKSAHEWRQIYKALQLLEFLIRHGSERVVDDARAHIATVSMLRSFHYTDPNGKDQGINVRNRAKELVVLLGDDEKIRAERKKARVAKDKYTGVSSEGGGFGGSGKKYGGFGSDSLQYGGYSSGVFGDGGGFGGNSSSSHGYSSHASDSRFEEYDAGSSTDATTTEYAEVESSSPVRSKAYESEKPKDPEVNLFSFDEPERTATSVTASAISAFDDEFDDFQSAISPIPNNPMATATGQASAVSSITGFFNAVPAQQSSGPSYSQPPFNQSTYAQPAYGTTSSMATTAPSLGSPTYFSASPGYQQPATSSFSSIPVGAFQASYSPSMTSQLSPSLPPSGSTPVVQQPSKKKDDVFGSLWTTAASGVSKKQHGNGINVAGNVTMGKLAQQSAQAGIWDQALSNSSSSGSGARPATAASTSGNSEDLLL
ncbi:uncharacterized protein V1513DRAFT_451891 [Lipomyces chichibuensis]|uniref:uncharacterized protein n=1 Tax=Lipomyces chichibuensis TaxID=1546026 RepID=UPI003343FC42